MASRTLVLGLDPALVQALDRLVSAGVFPSRDRAIEDALREMLPRVRRARLAAECEKLDPAQERALAEEGLGGAPWPEY